MGLLRSEAMTRGTLILPSQGAQKSIEVIGRKTKMQFEDMNAREMRRPYRKYVQRLDEMERILRFIYDEIEKQDDAFVIKGKIDEFLEGTSGEGNYKLNDVEMELKNIYKSFTQLKEKNTRLQMECNAEKEELEVVKTAENMFTTGGGYQARMLGAAEPTESNRASLLGEDYSSERRLGCLSGVVLVTDEMRFSRALWRASRGNTFTQFVPINDTMLYDQKTDSHVKKSVYVIYFQGSAGSAMETRLLKVCAAFGTASYKWPADHNEAIERRKSLADKLHTKEEVLGKFQEYVRSEIDELLRPSADNMSGNSRIEEWRLFCAKEKSVYTVLNLCESQGDGLLLSVNVWFPSAERPHIEDVLKRESPAEQKIILKTDASFGNAMPPTYIRTNDFTGVWQDVISEYGVPRYQEANPALISTVTFPFVFGMMYGDVGHGFLLVLLGMYLIRKGESLNQWSPELFKVRYLVFQLGLYATFAGFIYNDFFSVGLQLFDTGFEDVNGNGEYQPTYDIKNSGGPGPYPFGLDWAWHGATNELLFVNSLKMKLSVLFGVLQMIVGLMFRFSNAIFERNRTDFICECIPFIVFMVCFFGWMDFLILYKWVHPVDNPPMIINSLICMAMGQVDKNPMFDGSIEMGKQLMTITMCTVPVMLIPKPISLYLQHRASIKKAKSSDGHQLLHDMESAEASSGGGHGHGDGFQLDEIIIHQIIETIEYVLGVVSHTASYLRIWALSLAHQQLSLVFFQKTIQMGLTMAFPLNGIMLYLMFGMWFLITVGVLLGMDVLECFLHTLRLHWVEFDQKFYRGDGYRFQPYDVKHIISQTET